MAGPTWNDQKGEDRATAWMIRAKQLTVNLAKKRPMQVLLIMNIMIWHWDNESVLALCII